MTNCLSYTPVHVFYFPDLTTILMIQVLIKTPIKYKFNYATE